MSSKESGIDAAELMAWWDRCEGYAKGFGQALMYARCVILKRLSAYDQVQVRELIELLERVHSPLRLTKVRLRSTDRPGAFCETQRYCCRVGIWAVAALAVYDADTEPLKNFARRALQDGDRWSELSRALVENHLKKWRGWRQAEDPQAWITRVARTIASREAEEDAPTQNPVPLDEIDGIGPEDIPDAPGPSSSLADTLARDPGLLEYAAQRARGLKHAAVRNVLGWTKPHAAAVQQRYLGWRRWLDRSSRSRWAENS